MKKLYASIVGCFLLSGCMGSMLRTTVVESGKPKSGVAEFRLDSRNSLISAIEDIEKFCGSNKFTIVRASRFSQVESNPSVPITRSFDGMGTIEPWKNEVVEYGHIFFNCGENNHDDRVDFLYRIQRQ